jgi:hypothetical protein
MYMCDVTAIAILAHLQKNATGNHEINILALKDWLLEAWIRELVSEVIYRNIHTTIPPSLYMNALMSSLQTEGSSFRWQ